MKTVQRGSCRPAFVWSRSLYRGNTEVTTWLLAFLMTSTSLLDREPASLQFQHTTHSASRLRLVSTLQYSARRSCPSTPTTLGKCLPKSNRIHSGRTSRLLWVVQVVGKSFRRILTMSWASIVSWRDEVNPQTHSRFSERLLKVSSSLAPSM